MRQLQTQAPFGLLMSALALISAPSAALAQEAACQTDTDCEHGYTCEEVSGGCPAIDCAEGSDCQIPECESTLGCVPARDCEADNDCAEGWKCATDQYSECATHAADPACAPGEECDRLPEPGNTPDCETKEVSYCAPPWTLPCESAADCGVGFECVELISMMCSGSSGGGSAGNPEPVPDPGFAPTPDGDPLPPEEERPSECTSEPTGEFACKLIETTCSTNADCPAGLACQESYSSGVSCGGATPTPDVPPDSGSGEGGSGGDRDPDADARPADCAAPEPTFACAPPSYFDGYGYGYDLEGRGEGTAGTDSSDDESSDGDADPNGDTGGTPTAAPVDDERELSSGDNDAADMTSESSGCSATGRSPASGSMLLMALAVLGLAVRRRVLGA